MSFLKLRPSVAEHQHRIEPIALSDRGFPPRPKPAPPGPHQLGSTTLENVETLTTMSAEELDKLADSIERAGQETAEEIRSVAERIRNTGRIANERLANFVHVASVSAEIGKQVAELIERRHDLPEDAPAQAAPEPGVADLAAIEKQITGATEEARHDEQT